MGSKGSFCPYCKNYASIRKDGKQYVHKESVGNRKLPCRASGMIWEDAKELRTRVDAGESVWVVMKELKERT